eukprot:m.258849 g.258849  ORF g.258849 m.258849 type:complete len:183 (+) comp19653_c0_seq2:227-775(+)
MLHYLQILILRTEYALFACREAVDRTKSDPKCASSKYQQRSKTAATRTCSRYGGGWSNKKLSVQIDNDVGARCGMSRLSSRYSSGGSDEDTSDGVGSSTTRLQARTCSAGSVDGSMSDGMYLWTHIIGENHSSNDDIKQNERNGKQKFVATYLQLFLNESCRASECISLCRRNSFQKIIIKV